MSVAMSGHADGRAARGSGVWPVRIISIALIAIITHYDTPASRATAARVTSSTPMRNIISLLVRL